LVVLACLLLLHFASPPHSPSGALEEGLQVLSADLESTAAAKLQVNAVKPPPKADSEAGEVRFTITSSFYFVLLYKSIHLHARLLIEVFSVK
jgi:hypothetical protein